MRHKNKGIILDRKKASREALLRNLATSLILFEKIKTTQAKAKAVQPFVEHYIHIGKKGGLTARRKLLQDLYDKNAVKKLLEYYPKRFSTRTSGYTRIIKIKPRLGDGAKMTQIEILPL